MTRHLYIHIPFCASICWFCDFKREINTNKNLHKNYLDKIIETLNKECVYKQFKTIYIGGGTPNLLEDNLLNYLLSNLKDYLDNDYEFSIECNPEFITQSQLDILKSNKVNRISLGVQTFNDDILKAMHRTHTSQTAINAIELIKKNNFKNFSCDFIYNYPNMSISDLNKTFNYIKELKIPHVSFYALEIKDNAILNKFKYKLDLEQEELQLIFINKMFKKLKYKRYEISNWCVNKSYCSKHNLAYWDYSDWKAIGLGAVGLENKENYEFKNKVDNWIKNINLLDDNTYYLNVLIMGLRKSQGIDLSIERNKKAFKMYKEKLMNYKIVNNHLIANDLDCLNDTIINLF
ncbi:MAG: radical SAM family heme chaperone HemW [Ureaplasma sp.]|nr:radical SAM family heme chaperone HemW [Ureaplasma sp.]